MSSFLPKVTVFLASYNQEAYICEAYESVLNQDYPNIEIVGFDNGSVDATRKIIESKYAKLPNVKFFYHTKNESNQRAVIEGIQHITGDFLCHLHGDDFYLPNKVRLQVECFEKLSKEYGVVYCPVYRMDQETKERAIHYTFRESGSVFRKMLASFAEVGAIHTISPLIRREVVELHPYRPELFTEGEDIFFRYAISHKFHYLDTPLAVARDHAGNQGKAMKLNAVHFLRTMEFLRKEPALDDKDRKAVDVFVAKTLRNYGWQGIRVAGDQEWAKKILLQALEWDKFQIFHPRLILGLIASNIPFSIVEPINSVFTHRNPLKKNTVVKADYH